MRFLLDTHVVLWYLSDSQSLGPKARRLIENSESRPLVSAASVMEIAIKTAIGKLRYEGNLPGDLGMLGLVELPITSRHAWGTKSLRSEHRDPFDRLLAAQAISEKIPLMTVDEAVLRLGVLGIRADI